MSKLDELIAELCPDGVRHVELSEISKYAKARIDASEVNQYTYVGVDNLLQNKMGKSTSVSVPKSGSVIAYMSGDILIGNIRPYLKKIWLADCNGGTNGDVLAIQINDRTEIIPEFLYYVLSSEQFFFYNTQNSKGAKMPRGDKAMIMKYPVPVPPLPVQSEIVRILDNFTELTAELTAELIARKKQYEYYASNLFANSSNDLVPMSELADFVYGYTEKASDYGDTRFIRITDINEQGCLNAQNAKYITLNNEAKKSLLSRGDLVMARTGATFGKTLYFDGDEPSVYASFLIKIIPNSKSLNNRFYWHFTKTSLYWEQATKLVSTGGQPQFNIPALKQVKIPLPQLCEQIKIADILDRFDTLCSDISSGLPAEIAARQKQYEYYRDKLLTFMEKQA